VFLDRRPPLGRQPIPETRHEIVHVVPEHALEDQLDPFLTLAHHVGVQGSIEEPRQGPAAASSAAQVVAGDPVRRHSVTTSPGFQSGLRSQSSLIGHPSSCIVGYAREAGGVAR
jgi:hypothetical protein